jgi:hypothetical protein
MCKKFGVDNVFVAAKTLSTPNFLHIPKTLCARSYLDRDKARRCLRRCVSALRFLRACGLS